MSARDRILARLRGAARASPGAPRAAAVAEPLAARRVNARPSIDGDIAARFRGHALKLSSTLAEVAHMQDVPAATAAYLRERALPMQAVCWPALAALDWARHGVAIEARPARESDKVGITEVFCAIAETGTLMTLSGEHSPPAASLLPETHIAVLRTSQIVPAMEEAWQRLRNTYGVVDGMPRAVNFISGPSRTADIEQTLTFGAHGPYRVHVLLVIDPA